MLKGPRAIATGLLGQRAKPETDFIQDEIFTDRQPPKNLYADTRWLSQGHRLMQCDCNNRRALWNKRTG
jgi:hypothetical protein